MADQTFTSGQILTAAQMTALQNNIGLTYITQATATSGSTISINNCFTSTFTAYRIVIPRATLGSASGLGLLMRASGTNTTTNYYNVRSGTDYTTGVVSTALQNNGTAFDLACITDTTSAGCVVDIYNPQVTQKTSYSAQGSDARTTGSGNLSSGGMLNNTTSYDGFTITVGVQIFSSITVIVYGYRQA